MKVGTFKVFTLSTSTTSNNKTASFEDFEANSPENNTVRKLIVHFCKMSILDYQQSKPQTIILTISV